MTNAPTGWNGIFNGHRVPFSLHAVLLGAAFVIVAHTLIGFYTMLWDPELGMSLVNPYAGQVSRVSIGKVDITSWVSTPLRDLGIGLGLWSPEGNDFASPIAWRFAGAWLILLGVWALFAPAICRVAALHITRDENLTFAEGLRFGAKKLVSTALPLAFLVVALGGLYVANGMLGLLIAIPGLGPIIAPFLAPIVFVFALLALWVLIGLIGGSNLTAAAVATEGSDGLDGIARAINYVFSRPWHVLLHGGLTLLGLGILLFLGDVFFCVTRHSLGTLKDSTNVAAPFMMAESAGDTSARGWYGDVIKDVVSPEGGGTQRVDVYRGQITSQGPDSCRMRIVYERVAGESRRFPPVGPNRREITFRVLAAPTVDTAEARTQFKVDCAPAYVIGEDDVARARVWFSKYFYALFFYLLVLVKYVFLGYAAAYFLSATTLSYLLLRKEVDGTETDEVYVEDELDPTLPPGTAAVVPPSAPASAPAAAKPAPAPAKPAAAPAPAPAPAPTPPAPSAPKAATPPPGPLAPPGGGLGQPTIPPPPPA